MGGKGSGRPLAIKPKAKGAAQVLAWLEARRGEVSLGDLAKLLGLDRVTLYRVLKGDRELSATKAVAMKRLTRVRCEAWAEPLAAVGDKKGKD